METRAPRTLVIAAAIVFALSVFGFTLFVWKSFGGPTPLEPKGWRFSVPFGPEAVNVAANSQARIAGVQVGKVVATRRGRRTILVEIELEERYAPLPRDARAIVRSKTLLGEAYVELTPGSRGAPKLPEGGRLPAARVQRAQQVDRVLAAFDEPTRRSFRRMLGGMAIALEGRGADLNAALGHADPTVVELERLMTVLDGQRDDVRGLVRDTGRALRAVGARDDALQELVTAGDEVFGATAARDRRLSEAIAALPPFVRGLRTTLEEVDAASRDAGPTLRTLRPVAADVRPALVEARRLVPQVEGLLADVEPLVPSLRAALPALTDVLGGARGAMRALDPAGRELVPVVHLLNAYRRQAVTALANAAAATNASASPPRADGSRLRYARMVPLITTEQVFGHTQRMPDNRFNPYPRPGALEDLAEGLRAFDCRNTANSASLPALGTPPPCREQPPWRFRGAERSFPRLEPFAP